MMRTLVEVQHGHDAAGPQQHAMPWLSRLAALADTAARCPDRLRLHDRDVLQQMHTPHTYVNDINSLDMSLAF